MRKMLKWFPEGRKTGHEILEGWRVLARSRVLAPPPIEAKARNSSAFGAKRGHLEAITDSNPFEESNNSSLSRVDLLNKQSADGSRLAMVRPIKWGVTIMLIPVGKGIEVDVDVSRFNNEVRDHV